MGIAYREVKVAYQGHEVVLIAEMVDAFSGCQLYLHLDGRVVDARYVTIWRALFGTIVALRGQLPPVDSQSTGRIVKAIANFRAIRNNDSLIFVDDERIHQQRAMYGAL